MSQNDETLIGKRNKFYDSVGSKGGKTRSFYSWDGRENKAVIQTLKRFGIYDEQYYIQREGN